MQLPESLSFSVFSAPHGSSTDQHMEHVRSVIKDYWIALISRECSLQGRKEVLSGKAKFGIFGDGKEIAQIAAAKAFRKGDHRAGYYRDQTFLMALGLLTVQEFYAQLYSDAVHDPHSSGRQMSGHFASKYIESDGRWTNQIDQYNISADISSTGGQMARALGLAMASKAYRQVPLHETHAQFSRSGQELCLCTIGDASTSEGVFWETINAAAVEQVPLVIAVWDDGYGISVPTEKQTVKGSISEALKGFKKNKHSANGIDIYTVKGYNYQSLCITFEKAMSKVRKKHRPALIHVQQVTQPLGHSTSGSHERYKSKERLAWEKEKDCILQMEKWMIKNGLLTDEEAQNVRQKARQYVAEERKSAWKKYQGPNNQYFHRLKSISDRYSTLEGISHIHEELRQMVNPTKAEVVKVARALSHLISANQLAVDTELSELIDELANLLQEQYGSNLLSTDQFSPLRVPVVQRVYDDSAQELPGYKIINQYFRQTFKRYPEIFAFGEDLGHIGDVNQGFAGLQEEFGIARIYDAGIREWSILGQGIGMTMRGLKVIAEVQYFDYMIYALSAISDDIATLRYRTNGKQQAPLIIRTRGHRLEGIWHAGSPLGMLLTTCKGVHVCVPRNMVQAAGMYQTLLQGNDPAIIIECLNGYRLKEKVPANLGEYTLPLGIPEIITPGSHLTLVTYGSSVRYAMEAVIRVRDFGISVELIDVQTLMPFDTEYVILNSVRKTNRILLLDEDVPGGGAAYMYQKVVEEQGAFSYLDVAPRTLCASDHRCAYGDDGDYIAKPQVEDIVEAIYETVFEQPLVS